MHSYWNACLFGFEYFQEIPTDLVHLISPHSPTQDITHYISREWSISPPPRSAASHLRPTLLVETAPCPAWARVWVGCQWLDGAFGTLKTSCHHHQQQIKKKLTARLLQVYTVFWHIIGKYTHCNCKYQLSTKYQLTELILHPQISPQ